ncbi:hypothetical protein IHE44_0002551 [Lamprotornis superbus]|uniref:Uncharacterized protein n=1 Tax=Lamprotornis superbus TaxID=245042 RepID=A0A835NK42_9PASS|nr:hypothetical protein IHE44_0002551 [Lamprotornis superbus]
MKQRLSGQDRAVPSEYLSQQACLSAEPELLKRWTNELLSLTLLWLHAVWQGLHSSAATKQPEDLKIRWHHKLIFRLHLGWSSKIACLLFGCLCCYFDEVEALLQGHYGAIGKLLSIKTTCGERFLEFTLLPDPSLHSVAVYTVLPPNDEYKPRGPKGETTQRQLPQLISLAVQLLQADQGAQIQIYHLIVSCQINICIVWKKSHRVTYIKRVKNSEAIWQMHVLTISEAWVSTVQRTRRKSEGAAAAESLP